MMIVIVIMMIVSGITIMALQPALKDARTNQAYEDVLMQLRVARQRAVSERKQYIICFGIGSAPAGALTPLGAPTARSVQMFRWDVGTALSAAAQISANLMPTDMQFQALVGLPNGPATVPDGFGTGATAIDFDLGVAAGIKNQVLFMPDGSAHDINGNLNSGIIYVARNADLYSSRAVTLYGATGRIRGWRLINSTGTPQWFQQ
jgi:type II secretory pathway pseudopilin PulG